MPLTPASLARALSIIRARWRRPPSISLELRGKCSVRSLTPGRCIWPARVSGVLTFASPMPVEPGMLNDMLCSYSERWLEKVKVFTETWPLSAEMIRREVGKSACPNRTCASLKLSTFVSFPS